MKTEATPNSFVEYAKKIEICPTRPWFNQHVDHYLVTSGRVEHYATLKLKEAKKELKELKEAAIENYLKIKSKEAIMEKMAIELENFKSELEHKNNRTHGDSIRLRDVIECLTQYKQKND